MRPGRLDLTIYRGATFRKRFYWKTGKPAAPVPFPPGSTATAFLRLRGETLRTFDTTAGATTAGSITLGELDGSIELDANVDETAALPAGAGEWALRITPAGGDAVVLLEGELTIVDTAAA